MGPAQFLQAVLENRVPVINKYLEDGGDPNAHDKVPGELGFKRDVCLHRDDETENGGKKISLRGWGGGGNRNVSILVRKLKIKRDRACR